MPIAPGTWGTLATAIVVYLLRLPMPLHLLLLAVVTFVGIYASEYVESFLKQKDPGCIVIDEAAGYLVATAFVPPTIGYAIAAFFLFRLFDITKPPPANEMQEIKGGIGVMADDLVAGLYANIVIQIWRWMT